jgi:hypothetical protein
MMVKLILLFVISIHYPIANLRLFLNTGIAVFCRLRTQKFQFRHQGALNVAVGDFNKDGNLDVVSLYTNPTDNFSLLLGDGNGNLAAANQFYRRRYSSRY